MALERSTTRVVAQEEANQALRKLIGYFHQVEILPRSCRTLDLKIITVIVIEFLQGLDQQKIEGEPDGAAPVGVAAEDFRTRLRRFIAHGILGAIKGQHVRMSGVILAEGTHAI